MSCLDNTDILRIVGGNSFQIAITVKARRVADGSEIEDFDLSASSPVLNLIHAGEKTRKYFVTQGNQAIISFDGSEGLGYYGMEMSGSYNSEAWRFCIEKVLQLVDTNAKANVPEWSFLVDDTYFIEGTISIYGGGGGGDTVQADWTETNPTSAAFILHKPDLSVYATKTEVASGLEGKQDTIADLTSIRYGAAAGATAYQKPTSGIPESDMSEGVQTSLDKADSAYQLPANGIPSSDMDSEVQAALEKANSAVQTETDPVFSNSPAAEITQTDINNWNAKQPVIADLADIREGAAAGASAVQPDEMAQAIDEVDGDIADINAKIPTAASNLNQLADKAYVNSSIATNSATYRGSFNLITDLGMNVDATHAQIAGALATAITTADNNDYAFVQIPDSASTPTVIAKIERYKHNGSGWVYEYDLNNSGFTAAQWAAINSGITSGLVGKLSDLPNNSELATLLNGKQNVISDLSAIRSGAAAGATAIQPADLTGALNDVEAEIAGLDDSKQDTIEDLSTIRSGAAAGATAYQKPSTGIPESDMSEGVQASLGKADSAYQKPSSGIPATDMDSEIQASLAKANSAVQTETDPVFSNSPAAEITQTDINNWNAKQPVIADLADIREGAAAGATAVQPDEMAQAIDGVEGDIDAINAKIPTAASNLNQLADKAYVNSSIATNSATYRGSFNLITDLGMNVDATHAQIAGALATAIATADNNDYAFVQIPDSASTPTVIAKIERYKHNGSGWVYEYDLNNSGFTAAQWAAINSGITSGLVGKLSDLPNNSELATLLNGKQNVISDLSAIRSGASAGATAVQPADLTEALNDVEDEIAGLDDSKQDTIEDLSTIRSGAADGATAYQKPVTGIPESDMSDGVQTSLGKADSAYQKPANGIPATDMDAEVQAALEKANTAVQTETDPVFSNSPAAEITQADINGWNAKQPAIADLADIREGAAAGATAVQPDEMAQAIDEVDGDIADINAKIPTAASNLNQLADKAYVNSSIATNSATYRGSFNLITDLGMNVDATHAQIAGALATAIATADNNDYAFVQIPDSPSTPTVIAKIERYKHNGSGWVYEYDLNNSGFTAAQWAAINSGITSGLVGKLSDLPNNSELATLLNGKQNVINDLSAIRSGASAGATAYQKPSGGIPASDMSSTVQQELSKANTAVQTETDPIFSASPAANITAQNIQTWNGEPAARQAADTVLQNSVSTLQTDLAAEATARTTADALLQQQYNALTQSDIIVGTLPATGVPNVIYRVPGTTDFTDYMWYDNQFVPMATYGLPISAEFVVDENLNKTQEEVNEEINGLVNGATPIELFPNSSGNWSYSTTNTYIAYAVPVHSGDVITAKWQTSGVKKGYRGIYESYPEFGQAATNLLSAYYTEVSDESIVVSADGYFVFWGVWMNWNRYPVKLVLNNKDITNLAENVREAIINNATNISQLQDEVAGIDSDIDGLEEDFAGSAVQMQQLNEKIGNVHTKTTDVPISTTQGGINGNVGSAVNVTGTNGYRYGYLQVSPGEKYTITTSRTTSANYPYYVYFTDNNDIIIDRKIAKTDSGGLVTETVEVPTGVTKMYLLQAGGITVVLVVKKNVLYDLQSQIDDFPAGIDVDENLSFSSSNPVANKIITPKIVVNKMLNDHGMFDLESNWWITDKYLEAEYADQEATALAPFMTRFRGRSGSGVYQIAVISDTHGSGAYSWKNIQRNPTVCHRSIAVFNKIAAYCDAALHGGDLSCDYGTSRYRDMQYMYEIIRKFSFNKPLFVTKGNHDENNNPYVETDMLNLDWDNKTYYVRDFESFTPVAENAWDGSPLYENVTELVSDKEFRNMVQHWLSPSGSVWGNGAYYYYDIDSVKIRFIVGNSFPVNDNHEVAEDDEYLWLAQTALNFSAKSTPSEWKVLMLRHTQSTSITDISSCINAFRQGSSWTYKGTTVNFGSVNGGGMTFIAHIHGHEHQNCFSNGAGYFDIGENAAFLNISYLGDASKYGLSVLSIDTANSRVYEDTIGGQTWCYDYLSNKLLIAVGQRFTPARSGLASPTISSSDSAVASVNADKVVAVSAGNATITVSGTNGSYSYPITVVNS